MPRCWRASGSLPGTCCVSCFPTPNPAINPSGAGTQPRHSDASTGIPPSQGGAGGPVPCPGGRSDAHPAAPNTRARGLSAGYQLGSGCTRRVISATRFLVLMGLQRWMEPSLLCQAAIGKGQGKMLLRSPPPPVNPSPGPHPGPGQALFPPQSSFPVAFGACLFAAFADSAQPCCPPDSSRGSGHGTARGMAWPGQILRTHLRCAGLPGSARAHLGGVAEPPTISTGCRSVGMGRQRAPQSPPRPSCARMGDMSTPRIAESPKATSSAHGTPPKRSAGSEGVLGSGLASRAGPRRVVSAQLSQGLLLSLQLCQLQRSSRRGRARQCGVLQSRGSPLPGPLAWIRHSGMPRPGALSPARS